MSNLRKVLEYASSKVGIKEGTSSHHAIIDAYNKVSPKPASYTVKYTDSWCATFVTHVFDACGLASLITRECSCGRMIAGMIIQGIWIEDQTRTPQIGDIVMYDWDGKDAWPEHVGIVESVGSTTITVIEGNYSDSVKRRTISRTSSYIRGYGRPNYGTSSTSTTTSSSATGTSSSANTSSASKSIAWVEELQSECNAQGLSKQVVDGIAGPITLKGCPTLKAKSKGNITKIMQARIIVAGYSMPKYGADGDFGDETKVAVKKYQAAKGLADDGIVGPLTWSKLLGL